MRYPHEGFYLEYVPIDDDLERLVSLQDSLEAYGGKRPVSPGKIHLTLLHVGKVDDVYQELLLHNPSLSKQTYFQELQCLADEILPDTPKTAILTSNKLELFGVHQNVLALKFEITPQLQEAHIMVLAGLRRFFERCAIDPAFMEDSPNFRWALHLKPHLTLYKRYEANIPDITLNESFAFRLAPIAGL